jgi:hypothetical protein
VVKRRLFNMLAVMSLVLCVATVALWCLSYRMILSGGYYRAMKASGFSREYGGVITRLQRRSC